MLAVLFLERNIRNFLIAFEWLLLNDFIDFIFLTFPYYHLTHPKIGSLLIFYMVVNLIILSIGLLFTLNILSNIKELINLPKKEIMLVPVLTSAVVEDCDL